ncbi:MAG: AMP-binding protein [Actinobacteria bacterium]|nr:AMP-binding protein [Actinomycetota bacterium]
MERPEPGARSMSFDPLTPTSFLRRSALVYRDRPAVVDGDLDWSYLELWERSGRLAGLLRAAGVGGGDRVAALGSNSQLMLLAHHGVPLAGAILVPMNVRLSAVELAYIVRHSGARVLLCDRELSALGAEIAAATGISLLTEDEVEAGLPDSPAFENPVADERLPLSINYTSGTTGRPKGVVYHHRGAYLQSLAMAFHLGLRADSVLLWIVPMFHCHGWCLTWGATAAGSLHVCQRQVDAGEIWRLIRERGVSHAAAAPTVLTAIAAHPDAVADPMRRPIRIATGGSPPSPTLLARMAELNVDITHAYGLTETFGPVMLCDWHPEWDRLDGQTRAKLKARQGVGNVIAEQPRIVDEDGVDVPADGETSGELVLRGNDVMLGYFEDPEASAAAQLEGWFRTGDVGVMHPDNYVELRDRSKDVIISGGENIASVEVEQAIASFPGVLEVAVVAAPDERWGERPVAFVTVAPGGEIDPPAVVAHVREQIAPFKAPREVLVVDDLPRTATGKIQKYVLRQQLWGDQERRIGA